MVIRLRSGVLVVVVATAACGGKVASDDARRGAAPVGTAADGCLTPSSADADSRRDQACARACARVVSCATPHDADECYDRCRHTLNDRGATAYAKCLDDLPCAEVGRSLGIERGPIGDCKDFARETMVGGP